MAKKVSTADRNERKIKAQAERIEEYQAMIEALERENAELREMAAANTKSDEQAEKVVEVAADTFSEVKKKLQESGIRGEKLERCMQILHLLG